MLACCRVAAGVFPPTWFDPDSFESPLGHMSPLHEFSLEYGEALDKESDREAADTESIIAAPITSRATLTIGKG